MSTKVVKSSGPLLGEVKEVATARNSMSNADIGGYMDPRPVNGISSTVILPGKPIDYAEEAFLIPHEAIRCEMLTFSRLLPYLNFDVHPWKEYFVKEWLVKFFIPAVHEHHDLEEHLVFPEYAKLGVEIPDYMVNDHKTLMDSLGRLSKIAEALEKACDHKQSPDAQTVMRLKEDLEKEWMFMDTLMRGHLTEEETFWPEQIRRFGEPVLDKITDKLLKQSLKTGGEPFEMFGVAVFTTAGCSMGHIKPPSGWAPPDIKQKISTKLPPPVHWFLVPTWVKKYEKYRHGLIACAGNIEYIPQEETGCGVTCGVM